MIITSGTYSTSTSSLQWGNNIHISIYKIEMGKGKTPLSTKSPNSFICWSVIAEVIRRRASRMFYVEQLMEQFKNIHIQDPPSSGVSQAICRSAQVNSRFNYLQVHPILLLKCKRLALLSIPMIVNSAWGDNNYGPFFRLGNQYYQGWYKGVAIIFPTNTPPPPPPMWPALTFTTLFLITVTARQPTAELPESSGKLALQTADLSASSKVVCTTADPGE